MTGQFEPTTILGRLRRRWLRYSLRTLLVLFTLVAVWLAVLTNRARRQQAAIEALREMSAGITFDFEEQGRFRPQTAPWLRRLLGDDYFQNVVAVTLRSTRSDDAVIAHLQYLPELKTLDVGGTRISDDGLRPIGKLRKLKSLTISFTGIDGRGFAHLANLDELVHLDISSTKVSDESLTALGELENLLSLQASFTGISDRGLANLAEAIDLDELDLADTKVTDEGMKSLAKLKNLSRLRLSEMSVVEGTPPRISDRGMKYLAQVPSLRELELMNQEITDQGLAQLAPLAKLEKLNILGCGTGYTAGGVVDLEAKIPTLVVSLDYSLPGSIDEIMRTRWVRAQPGMNQAMFRARMTMDRAKAPR